MSNKTIMVSGGFDPIHEYHCKMIQEAAKYGKVIVVANSDEWLIRKKGFYVFNFEQRKAILECIKGVELVVSVDDSDGTVCDAIKKYVPDYFANGGDRKLGNTPEVDLCNSLDIQCLWGIGGDFKGNSSSDVIKRVIDIVLKK